MGHYNCVQLAYAPLNYDDIKDYSVDVEQLSDHPGADYCDDCDNGEALDSLVRLLDESIEEKGYLEGEHETVRCGYVVVNRKLLQGKINTIVNEWKKKVSKMSVEDILGKYSYTALYGYHSLSNGDLFSIDGDYPMCSLDALSSILRHIGKKKNIRLYCGASIDFHS